MPERSAATVVRSWRQPASCSPRSASAPSRTPSKVISSRVQPFMVGRRSTRMPGSVMSTRNMLRPSRTGPSARVRAVVMHQSALCAPVTSTFRPESTKPLTVGNRRGRLRAEVAARVLLGVRDAHLDLAPLDERHEARSLRVARERAERVARERDRGVDERSVERGHQEVEAAARRPAASRCSGSRAHPRRGAARARTARRGRSGRRDRPRSRSRAISRSRNARTSDANVSFSPPNRKSTAVPSTRLQTRPKNMLRRCRPLTASCATSCTSPTAGSRC